MIFSGPTSLRLHFFEFIFVSVVSSFGFLDIYFRWLYDCRHRNSGRIEFTLHSARFVCCRRLCSLSFTSISIFFLTTVDSDKECGLLCFVIGPLEGLAVGLRSSWSARRFL